MKISLLRVLGQGCGRIFTARHFVRQTSDDLESLQMRPSPSWPQIPGLLPGEFWYDACLEIVKRVAMMTFSTITSERA
ncbi:hypothetical protein NLA06_00550 [Desulfomicrobium sp. ZS1]|jgi:hypothetical protein|uniref:hypothetical protein n=1 Tax=Desulfomicrobium sp. ZS1 TaxID=2952228 RepID=UPI0020B2EBE9|nr:hypothetical protein [Desulfomicrobium sp. ZS1]UTF50406.1 hypothetical protein NLA06_00550 [Desulfomicrobium sp. ZS1]